MARRYPKTEAQKAQAREYAKRKYWEDPERFRAESSEHGKRKRAENRASGVKPKPRARTETEKAAQAERMRRYYLEDPEKYRTRASENAKRRRPAINAAKRASYAQNLEEAREQQRTYREGRREQIRAAARNRIDPVENRARVKAWRRANPHKARALKLRRRARELNAPVIDFTPEQWQELLEEFDGKCAYCPAAATTQDHLTPLSRGGSHTASNIVPACKPCNSSKGTRTMLEFLALGRAA